MKKINYPSKEVIDVQIKEILKKSEMFNIEEENDDERTVQCVSVKEKFSAKSVIPLVGIIAAAAVIILMVNNYSPINKSEDNEFNPLSALEIINGDTDSNREDVLDSSGGKEEQSTRYYSKETDKQLKLEEYNLETSMYDKENINISKYGPERIAYYDMLCQMDEWDEFLSRKADEAVEILSNKTSYSKINPNFYYQRFVDKNIPGNGIVTLIAAECSVDTTTGKSIPSSKGYAKSFLVEPSDYVSKAKALKLEDIFTDAEAAKKEIEKVLKNKGISIDMETAFEEGNWYLSETGFMIIKETTCYVMQIDQGFTINADITGDVVDYSYLSALFKYEIKEKLGLD